MTWTGKPDLVFELWANGIGDIYVAFDKDLPIPLFNRIWYRIRGEILITLFNWWWWSNEE